MEVVGAVAFQEWFEGLDDRDTDIVVRLVDLLEAQGIDLGAPYSTAIRGSRYAMREFRSQSRRRPLRVFYVFDPERSALVLTGGDKSGYPNARAFYAEHVPAAEVAYEGYLADTGLGTRKGEKKTKKGTKRKQ